MKRKLNIKKSHCDIHATFRQRLKAIKLLSHEHKITTLCRVLNVNRSTYYKYINHRESNREKENRRIRTCILDLFSRKVIAYKLSNKIDTKLAIDTVNSAVAARGKSSGIIFHTDRGSQFTSAQFRRHLDNLNMIQSFSAKGHPYDNAVMECFFKHLKKEEVNRKSYSSFEELNFLYLSILMASITL